MQINFLLSRLGDNSFVLSFASWLTACHASLSENGCGLRVLVGWIGFTLLFGGSRRLFGWHLSLGSRRFLTAKR